MFETLKRSEIIRVALAAKKLLRVFLGAAVQAILLQMQTGVIQIRLESSEWTIAAV